MSEVDKVPFNPDDAAREFLREHTVDPEDWLPEHEEAVQLDATDPGIFDA